MSEDKKLVKEITARSVDFARWYTDIVLKAELCDYSTIKGCMILRPAGYAIWERIQSELDSRFKDTGHENVAMPMFIPEGLLQKEKDHVEGFAPEVAWVTYGGSEKLQERLCIRPTSETLFCDHYSKIIQSHRDLPKLYNQWCSVVRWEKTTRPFLRTTEFFWQEGHTIHETSEEAVEETVRMLNTYEEFLKNVLAIPVIKGKKTDKEKFAGAIDTYTVEAIMRDGKALQSGTSHYFGDGFSKAFEIQYSDKNNNLKHPFQTSWGMSTRIIGALIMVHGDDSGLVLPPNIAPIQIMLIPIAQKKPGVLEAVKAIEARLKAKNIRVKIDASDKSPGWKFSEQEMKGIPLRLEIGPKDIEKNQALACRRDTREKIAIALDDLETDVLALLEKIQLDLYNSALDYLNAHIEDAKDWDAFADLAQNKPGFIRAMWCGELSCEELIKERLSLTSRCIPEEQEQVADICVACSKDAKHMVYWGKAY